MVTRLFLIYLVAEAAALVALVSTIGFGWTALLLVATFLVGIALAGSQAGRQLARLRAAANTQRRWQGWQDTAADSALVALGTVLVVLPGLVTSAVGLLLLVPATRSVARPMLAAIAAAGLGRRAPLIAVASAGVRRYANRPADDFIDGEVINVTDVGDVTDVEPPALSAD